MPSDIVLMFVGEAGEYAGYLPQSSITLCFTIYNLQSLLGYLEGARLVECLH